MQPALLVVLALIGQVPAEPAAGVPATVEAAPAEGDLERLERWARPTSPLPDADTLQRALDVRDMGVSALRERANVIRLQLASAARGDAGVMGADAASQPSPTGDGGVEDPGDDPLQRARLDVLERLIAEQLTAGQALVQRRLDEARAEQRLAEEQALRAEAAQQRALADARNARSALLERAYARVAQIEGLNALVASHRAALHDQTSALLAQVGDAGEDAARLLEAARKVSREDAGADALLLEVLAKQRALIDSVGEALHERDRTPEDLEPVPLIQRGALDDAAQLAGALGSDERSDVERGIAGLRSAADSLAKELETLRAETSERWYRVAERRLEVAGLLDDARLALLERATLDMRAKLHGLSEDGAQNLQVASRQLWWSLRFHVVRRAHDARHLDQRLSDGIQLGKVVWALSLALFALLLSAWGWRRAPALFERAKKVALQSAQTAAYARFVGSWLSFLEALAPRSFLIALTLWLHDVLTEVAPEPELTILVEMVVWVLSYQLASRLLHMLILRLARRRLSLSVVQKLRVLRSVRLALRYGFVIAYGLDVMERLVGNGVLFQGIRVLALLGAVPVLAVLVHRWRDDIVTAYLAQQPDSRLARAVERARGHWYGFFVAVAAFGVVAGHGVGVLGRDFVLGFEQSRKALAYLFRLRIERQAQRRGFSPIDVSELPDAVREAFADRPVEEGRLLVDRFSELPRARELLRAFPNGHTSLVVHSPWGVGRTTWLLRLSRELPEGHTPLWWSPTSRITSTGQLFQGFAELLGRSEAATSLRELSTQLSDAGPRVLFLDGLEQLFLRSVDGYAAIEALTELMDRTRRSVFWVLSSATSPYRHLCQTRHLDQHVGGVVSLGRWSESEIRELIQTRQRSSGIKASFEDLIVHAVEGDRLPTQVVETEEGYIRLLWNFAEGNPRVAQLFWLRSLYRTAGGELRVRLYSAHTPDELEVLSERERFVLSAVHLHGALRPSDAARACRLPESVVNAHFARGIAMGLYGESDAGSAAYAVSLDWWQAVVRYLRRKNLLM